jgi:hypothetical protein
MSELHTGFEPYGVLISRVLRDAPHAEKPSNHDGPFEIYVGVPERPVAFQAAENVAIKLPAEWEPHIAGIYKLRPLTSQQLHPYSSERYFVRFNASDELLRLVLNNEVDSLVSIIGRPAIGTNLRRDPSVNDQGLGSAILVLFESSSEEPTSQENSHARVTEYLSEFRTALGQNTSEFLVAPSRFGNLFFTKGPTVGSLLDSAAVLRLNKSKRDAFSLPYEAMDWVDFADIAYIVRDLGDRLKHEAPVDPKEYLSSFASAEIADLYDRFMPTWSNALGIHLSCRETRGEIDSAIRSNIFHSNLGTGETGIEFHRQVAARFHTSTIKYQSNETRLLNRIEILSSFLRDAAAWQSAQTHTSLARAQNDLVQAQNALADTNNKLTRTGNENAESTKHFAENIAEATKSTDNLTVKVVRLTRWVVILTVLILILTVIGALGALLTEPMRDQFWKHFSHVEPHSSELESD